MAKDFRADVEFNNSVSFLGNTTATSSISFRPQLIIKNTNTDAFSSYLVLAKAPSDNLLSVGDDLGTVMFQGIDTTGTLRNSSYISAETISQGSSYVGSDLWIYTTSSAGTTNAIATFGANLTTTLYGALTASVGLTTLGTASTGNITSTGSVVGSIIHSNNNGGGTNFRVGDDAWIGDINLTDTISIRGISGASSNGYIRFGSDSNSFGYNGSSLTYSGSVYIGGDLTASVGTTNLGPTTLTDVNGINFASTNSASEGGQINLLGGTSYSSSPMKIDNYQGNLRVLYSNGSSVAFTVSQSTGSLTLNTNLGVSTIVNTGSLTLPVTTGRLLSVNGYSSSATSSTNVTATGTTPAGFGSFTLTSGRLYEYKIVMFYQVSVTTVAFKSYLTYPTLTRGSARSLTATNATAFSQAGSTNALSGTSVTITPGNAGAANTTLTAVIEGFLLPSASGTFSYQFGPATAGTASAMVGSYITVREIG